MSNHIVNFTAHYSRGTGELHKDDRNEYRDRFNCKPNCSTQDGGPPYFSAIIFITSIVFYCMYNVGVDSASQVSVNLINSPWIYKADLVCGGNEVWRYFTYSFLHADFAHIFSNMLIFLLVCPMLELAHDSIRPALIYIVGVVLGSTLAGIWSPNNYLVGASGGVYAVVVAHLANIILNCGEMDKAWLSVRAVILAPLLGAAFFDVYKAYVRYFLEQDDVMGGVSYAAHVGGTLTGLFFGVFILRNYESHVWEKFLRWIFLILYALFWVYASGKTVMLMNDEICPQQGLVPQDLKQD